MATATSLPSRKLKLPAAADHYGIAVKTLRRLIASGRLTGYRLGNRVILVDVDELEQLLEPIAAGGGPDAA